MLFFYPNQIRILVAIATLKLPLTYKGKNEYWHLLTSHCVDNFYNAYSFSVMQTASKNTWSAL